GHSIYQPDHLSSILSPQFEEAIYKKLTDKLKSLDAGFGYASVSNGMDILFLEAMLERKVEVHIILPFSPDEFQKTIVESIPGADWGGRYRKIIERATRIIVASEHRTSGSTVDFKYSNLLLNGLAILKAETLDTRLSPIVAASRRPLSGTDGIRKL